MPGGDPREGFGALGTGYLHEFRPGRQSAEKAYQRLLVRGQFVDVVGGEDIGFLTVKQSEEFAARDDVPIDLFAVERDDRIRRAVAPADVPALNVDAEHQ
jgi:hypothetical protein